MGEEEWRVHRAGAPSLDHLRRSPLLSREEVEERLGIHFTPPTALVAFHPTTIARDLTREADALFTQSNVLRLRLEIAKPDMDSLRKNPRKYVKVTLREGDAARGYETFNI